MLACGLIETTCIMSTFTVIVHDFNNCNLGVESNNDFSEACQPFFRARYLLNHHELGVSALCMLVHRYSSPFLYFEQSVSTGRSIFGVTNSSSSRSRKLNHAVFPHDGSS
jgi:hypothetical protein